MIMTSASRSDISEPTLPKMKPEKWPHKPVFVQAGNNMKVLGVSNDQPVPLGIPFEIESNIFKGKVLLRFRNALSDDPDAHSEYFKGGKRLMQTVVQGRFKRPIKMSDLYVGSVFPQPLAGAPPPTLSKIMSAVIGKIAPGLIMDLSSDSPRVIALLGGTAQTMSIDARGKEPDITLPVIKENVVDNLGKSVGTKEKRQKILGNPKKASSFTFDTNNVYTFHTYDEAMDYGHGTMHLPLYGEYDIKPMIGRQPLSLTATTEGGEVLYDLRIWHESHAE